jgi:Uma2 family endonuclease
MTAPARKPATYADLLALPATMVGEIIGGRLHAQPRPRAGHGAAGGALGSIVTGSYQFGRGGPGGWLFIDEPELHLGRDIVVPDIAGWRTERIDFTAETVGITTAPDWVCEVLSPTTEKLDRGPKRAIYGAAGVGHLWLLDPRARLLEAFANVNGQWLLIGVASSNDEVALAPFEAAPFALGLLFPLDPPSDEPAA